MWAHKALFEAGARELLLQAVVQGVLIGAVSIFVYTRAVASLGPAAMARAAAVVPVITTLAAIPLVSEVPSRFALAGVAVVTVGCFFALCNGVAPDGRKLGALTSVTG